MEVGTSFVGRVTKSGLEALLFLLLNKFKIIKYFALAAFEFHASNKLKKYTIIVQDTPKIFSQILERYRLQ